MEIKRPRAYGIAVLSFLGFLDAGLLSYYRLAGAPIYCGASNICEQVAQSEYSNLFFGIPNSYLGTLFYFAIFLLMIAAVDMQSIRAYVTGMAFTAVSLAMSAYLFWVQATIIGGYCPYCVASGLVSLGMFGLSAWNIVEDWLRRRQA